MFEPIQKISIFAAYLNRFKSFVRKDALKYNPCKGIGQ